MAPIVHSIEIARPPEEVFAYVTDPTTFPEWQNDVVSVHLAGPRFTTTRRIGGTERSMTQEVTETVAPVRWAAHGVDGPIRPDATVTVEPVAGGTRSRITFTLDFTGRGIGVPILPLVRKQARKAAPVSYQNLRRLLEGPRV